MRPALEEDWGDLESLPPSRSGAPKWVWGCAAGCLVLVIACLVLAKLGWDLLREATDAERQWPRVAEVLPFDERPAGYDLRFGVGLSGYHGFWLTSSERAAADGAAGGGPRRSVFLMSVGDADRGRALVDTRGAVEGEVETGEIEIQGRRVPIARYVGRADPGLFGPDPPASANLQVDLSREGDERSVLVILSGPADDPPTDDELREFLAPFHVGPERGDAPPADPPDRPDDGR